MKKNIYLISQDENTCYDTYDSAVVVAPDEETAKRIHPRGLNWMGDNWENRMTDWCSLPDQVKVKLIGKASKDKEIGVVCASFNAG
jgi:hypothetical protein